ncbi:helix-turn-helix domain-containing protein [Clostridium sp.]|uniref:helix-turn-helix domain-containing protein n=1 Tax=Clostridium sp. TaxID=1506 RepID=UPI00290AD426|nr:helix-turn-helix domain-containing protein [Clostridium sp.]MDU7212505.1 helix-turn-helix domain-containing protein [Clostridium sp.]
MADVHKSYYAIIPANIRYDSSITPNAKLLYGEITALCNEKGYCWANNEYFASLYGVSKVSISKWIRQLVKKGYIDSVLEYKEGTKEILNRYLTIVNDPIKEKFNTPIKEKFKDNNTLINNTSNNKKEKRKTEFDLLIEGYTEDLQLRNTIYEFLKMRKAIKAPMTSNALKLMLNKLDRLAPKDIHCDLRISILEQSIMNSWKGIFELKEELKKKVVPEDRHYGFDS